MNNVLNQEMQKMIMPILKRENGHTLKSVEKRLGNNSAKLFCNETALIVAELVKYPLAKVTNIWMGAGDLNGIKSLLPEVEMYAEKMGCSRLEFTGREGWKRWTEKNDLGWTMKNIVMEKEIA
tara:strand:- start:500 stop:868 length:369 start_codon:yes stop_codon:yes gene_type:complete